ncbi:MAG TPA: hypothetical protein DER33_04520 [Syntrophomonas sp.]|nr:hypothetical protein [Syntrophomonas sp.]
MKSRTSFINKGILRNDIKSMGWIGAVYLLGLLASLPLQIFMIHSRETDTVVYNSINWIMNNPYLRLFQLETSPLLALLLIVMPVLTGMMLFRYLHYDQTVDLLHCLPVKRTTLYNTHLVAGIIFLFVPVLITALISALALNGLGITYVPHNLFFSWLGLALVTNLFFLIMTAAIGMMCGISWVQGALTFILLILPTAFLTLLYQNMNTYIYGFAIDFYSINLENLSPLLHMFNYSSHPFTGHDIAVYLLYSLILYLLGWYLYKRRQLEMAGNALAFTFLFPIFKYGMAFCAMLLLGSYFNSVQNHNIYWTYFGYLLGSLLGYWLSEILIYKTLHVFNHRAAKGYLGFGLAMVILISGLNYDLTGYEKKLPELTQVESVYLDHSFYPLTNKADRYAGRVSYEEVDDTYHREVSMFYTQPETVQGIFEFHKAITSRGQSKDTTREDNSYQHFCFAYKLKNGDMFYREYNVPVKSFAAALKPIYESQEYKMKVNDVLHISPRQVDVITIAANEIDRSVKITDPEQIKEAITILQEDINKETYEDIASGTVHWGNISIILNTEKRLELDWQKSYDEFDAWLQDTGKTGRLVPADIQYLIVQKRPENTAAIETYRTKNPEEYLADIKAKGDYIKITDSAQIDACLRTYTYRDNASYKAVFVLKNGDTFVGGFDEENKPGFLK